MAAFDLLKSEIASPEPASLVMLNPHNRRRASCPRATPFSRIQKDEVFAL